jgi:VPDSG-CTERM motif
MSNRLASHLLYSSSLTHKNEPHMKKLKYIAPVLIAIACFGLQQVKANVISFDLTAGNSGLSGFTGPYATVTVNQMDSTHATITFDSLTSSGKIYLMSDGSTIALNVNATTFTTGTPTWSQSGQTGFSAPSFTVNNAANQQVDGFGRFNLTVDNSNGFPTAVHQFIITLTNTSGGPGWLTANDVLSLNDPVHNALAAAHIFVTANPAVQSAGALTTGYAAGSNDVHINPLSTPDGGATVMLLGAALGALGMARRYLKR